MTTTAAPEYRSVDPATGAVGQTFPFIEDGAVEGILATAHESYKGWRTTPLVERSRIALRVAELLKDRAEDLAALAQAEMGKPREEAVGEVYLCSEIFAYYANNAEALLRDQPLETELDGTAVLQSLAIGVVLGVMPWNFPYYQVARFFAPNLMVGNTVLLKHAESVPRSALALAALFADAGVPQGVYTNVFANHAQIETIIEDRRVRGVSLTGSERAGAAVAATAGRALKKCVLELGGSDPFVVLDTPDVDALAELAWQTRMYNNGQACNSNKRMIVHESIAADFIDALTRRAQAVDLKSCRPMASRAAAERLAAIVREAVKQGATLHAGGELAEGPAALYTPAVLSGVTSDMRVYHEELFGPVAVVYSVADDDAAVDLANATRFGLGGSVFGTDPARAADVATRIDCGMTHVNAATAASRAELPFGGTKGSGFGRELGPTGIHEFTNKRLYFTAAPAPASLGRG
ncbi:aldehyde dehydrogenase family protein [Streptomyces fuscichromogenes]|uniref:aldehyde dehydrogenase family protein n=1 Tax=Streptomyces fuscichromogenes TaxID=1324013 RepID=UPI00380F67C8